MSPATVALVSNGRVPVHIRCLSSSAQAPYRTGRGTYGTPDDRTTTLVPKGPGMVDDRVDDYSRRWQNAATLSDTSHGSLPISKASRSETRS